MFFDNLVVNKMASGCLMLTISSRGSEAINKHPTTVWIVNGTLVELRFFELPLAQVTEDAL